MDKPFGHSAQGLGPHRAHLWNRDFLELALKRCSPSKAQTLLDVGCGQGDWGRTLSEILPTSCKITGIDFEPNWIKVATSIAEEIGLSSKFTYLYANAEELPFEDSCFDIVTCQTVLMHVKNPQQVISEMRRVLKPGGVLFVAEPSTLADKLVLGNIDDAVSNDDLVRSVILQRRCIRGAKLVGDCSLNIGDELPGLLLKEGLREVNVCMSDKPICFIPPYDDPLAITWIEMLRKWDKEDLWYWKKEEAKKYFITAGGIEREFEESWLSMRMIEKERLRAIDENTYVCTGGHVLYLISAKK